MNDYLLFLRSQAPSFSCHRCHDNLLESLGFLQPSASGLLSLWTPKIELNNIKSKSMLLQNLGAKCIVLFARNKHRKKNGGLTKSLTSRILVFELLISVHQKAEHSFPVHQLCITEDFPKLGNDSERYRNVKETCFNRPISIF